MDVLNVQLYYFSPPNPTWFRQNSTKPRRYHIRVPIFSRSSEPVSHLKQFGILLLISHSSHSAFLKHESGVLGRHKSIQSPISVLLPHLFLPAQWCIKMFGEVLKVNISIHLRLLTTNFVTEEINLFKNGKLHAHLPFRMVSALRYKEPLKPNNMTTLLSMSFMSFHLVSAIDMKVPSCNNDLFVWNTYVLSNNKQMIFPRK